MLVNSGVICAEHLRSRSRDIENQESVELFCRTGQALRIFEDPEGCRHEDYYLKIGQAAIKKPEPSNHHDGLWGQPNAELESTDCKSTPWSSSWGTTIQTHHGAILRCRDVLLCRSAHRYDTRSIGEYPH